MKTNTVPSITLCGPNLGILALGVLLFLKLGVPPLQSATTPPNFMSYQGFLQDENAVPLGSPAPLNYTMSFRIYGDADSDDPIWAEQQVVTVDNGVFSVLLGEGTIISGDPRPPLSDVFTGANVDKRFIGVTVNALGANEIRPRVRLLPSPYSYLAAQANKLVGSTGSDVIANNGTTTSITGQASIGGGFLEISRTSSGNTGKEMIRFSRPNGPATSSLRMNDEGDFIIRADGDIYLEKKATAQNDLLVNGSTTLGDNSSDTITIKGPITASSSATLGNGNDTVAFGARLNQNNWSGAANFLKATEFAGNLTQSSGTTSLKNTTVAGTATVTGETELEKARMFSLAVGPDSLGIPGEGSATFNGEVVINGGLDLDTSATRGAYRPHLSLDVDGDSKDWAVSTGDAATGELHNTLNLFWGGQAVFVLQTDGDLQIDGSLTQSSDRRLKKNIEPLEGGVLDQISRLPAVRYHMNTDAEQSPKRVGFIAQDVQAVFPELVHQSDEFLSLAYADFGVLSVAAIKELRVETDDKLAGLKEQNEQLKSENATLKKQFSELLSRLQALENKVQ